MNDKGRNIPVRILRSRRLLGMLLITLVLPELVFFFSNFFVTLIFLIVFTACTVLIFLSYYSERKNAQKSADHYVLSGLNSLVGFGFVIAGLFPIYFYMLKDLGLYKSFFSLDIDKTVSLLELSSRTGLVSENHNTGVELVFTVITALLNSYYISFIAVFISFVTIIAAVIIACLKEEYGLKIKNYPIIRSVPSGLSALIESVPRVLLICILLSVVIDLTGDYKIKDYSCFVGIIIGVSCIPLVFRRVDSYIRKYENTPFAVSSRIHGVSYFKIIWYHILYKNCYFQLLIQLLIIWQFAIYIDIGLSILISREQLSIPGVTRAYFSLGSLLASPNSSRILSDFFLANDYSDYIRYLFSDHIIDCFKLLCPLLLIFFINTGLLLIQNSFQSEKENDSKLVPVESLSGYDRVLNNVLSLKKK